MIPADIDLRLAAVKTTLDELHNTITAYGKHIGYPDLAHALRQSFEHVEWAQLEARKARDMERMEAAG